MEKYKISIITVTKNSEKYLKKNIRSVLNQSYKNYEHIIVDGNSNDNTIKIIKSFKNKIKLIKNHNDKGLYHAMNVGIKNASGDIIGILNSDDTYFKNSLKLVNKYFNQNKNLDFLFGSVYKHRLLYGYRPSIINWSFGFYTTHSVGFFIKKKSQFKVGLYNLKYKYSSDYDYFFRMIVKKKLNGIGTKKEELFGIFNRGGYSSRVKFIDHFKEEIQIRKDNGQSKILLLIIIIYKTIKNFKRLI